MRADVLGGDEGASVLVTGTHDVAAARAVALNQAAADVVDSFTDEWTENAGEQRGIAARQLAGMRSQREFGRKIPDPWHEFTWVWRGWPAEGRERAHGESLAVRFFNDDAEEKR